MALVIVRGILVIVAACVLYGSLQTPGFADNVLAGILFGALCSDFKQAVGEWRD